jgi:hypothetical protein
VHQTRDMPSIHIFYFLSKLRHIISVRPKAADVTPADGSAHQNATLAFSLSPRGRSSEFFNIL